MITQPKLPTPAQVVDQAIAWAEGRTLRVHRIGAHARWNPQLLHRAHNEAVRRYNLARRRSLSWHDDNVFNGVVNALSLAYDNSLTGPRGRRSA